MMKLYFKHIIKQKFKAFTLIEIVISVSLISLLSIGLLKIVFATNLLSKELELISENQLKLEYGLNYIINEIDSADLIIEKNFSSTKYKDNLGILLVKVDNTSKKEKYSVTTYVYDKKQLIRINEKYSVLHNRIDLKDFNGNNPIIDNLESFDAHYNEINKVLKISLENEFEELEKIHFIRGVIYDFK